MLKIRLQRTGRKNDPAFRMVVAEHTIGAKSGKIVERVGSHHPKTKETIFDGERIKYWMSVGAKASDRVHNMLISEGIIEGKKINVLPKKTPVEKESNENSESNESGKEISDVVSDAPANGGGENVDEKPVGETVEAPAAEASEEGSEEAATETTEESPVEETVEEKPAEEEKKEEETSSKEDEKKEE